jgi:hypothetical protein
LALLPGAFAPALVADVVRLGSWAPFPRVPELVRLFFGTHVSEPTVRRLTEDAGAAHVAVQTAAVDALERSGAVPPAGPAVLQASVDGAMVPLRGKGEWAEVKTLALGEVVTTTTAGEPVATARGPVTTALTYFSRRADHETFTRLATVETHARGLETAGTVCGVADGADWCQQFFDTQRPDAVRILDFPHAVGYLAQVAQAAYGTGTVVATTWLEAQRHTLRHQPPDVVLAAIRALQETVAADSARPDGATATETIGKCLAYLEKRQDQLRYATFAAAGYPIGSGIVESANKLVVEARLKGAGMHWAPDHVDPMVALRTVACADRWDQAWPAIAHELRAQHRRQAQARAARRRARHLATATAISAPPTACGAGTPATAPEPIPAPATRERLSYGPGRPAPNHPWKRRFLVGSPRTKETAKN